MPKQFRGSYTVTITPFTADGKKIDIAAWKRFVDWQIKLGVPGIIILGTTGEAKRTDRQGLLLLISPPGYGKTTLMEYIANRLGIIFMKINGDVVEGITVMAVDDTEAAFINVIGNLNPAELEKVMDNFDVEIGNGDDHDPDPDFDRDDDEGSR